MTEITREEFGTFKEALFSRLDRMDDKLDEIPKCMYQKVPREECTEHRKSIWSSLDSLTKKVYVGVGILVVVNIVVWPIVLWLVKGV